MLASILDHTVGSPFAFVVVVTFRGDLDPTTALTVPGERRAAETNKVRKRKIVRKKEENSHHGCHWTAVRRSKRVLSSDESIVPPYEQKGVSEKSVLNEGRDAYTALLKCLQP